MKEINCKEVAFGSDLYHQSIDLRDRILRQPLGLQFSKEELLQENDSHHLVYLEKGEVIGVIVMRPIDENIFKMRQVAIDSIWQRKGIGQTLVNFSETFSKLKNRSKIILHARDTAIPFYQKLGYQTVGNEFVEVGIKHYKMEKAI
ncbi:MAG: GNAT family N-acetyltransferase [Chitinophagales bacterium]|jgi:predicted GNAT family N-acyltransferase